METQREYTLGEVIETVVRDLSRISVPIELMEQVAMPISVSIGNLKACLEAMKRDAEKQKTLTAADGGAEDDEIAVTDIGFEAEGNGNA